MTAFSSADVRPFDCFIEAGRAMCEPDADECDVDDGVMSVVVTADAAAPVDITSVLVPLIILLFVLPVRESILAAQPIKFVVFPLADVDESNDEPVGHIETASGASGSAAGGATAAIVAQFTIAEQVERRLDGAIGFVVRALTEAFALILVRAFLCVPPRTVADAIDVVDGVPVAVMTLLDELPRATTELTTPEVTEDEPVFEDADVAVAARLLTKGLRLSRSARL